ncbi:unnamed protein product [Urochloa decumbens]|uniref:DUF4220 domain-containing protein n=1 Tax=Urochloa decumbens TaxID=240449 RepID=A0ABC8W6V8_9POAL
MMAEEHHLSVRNATRAATAWVGSPVGRLARIEVLVTLSSLLLSVLVLLGTSRSSALRLAVWSALMLSYPAVSYTIGLMQSASFRNELIVVWGCFLLLLLGCTDGIAAYRDDSDQLARTVLNQGLQLLYVLLLFISYVGSLPLQLKVLLLLLWALSAVKLGMRVWRSSVVANRDRVLTVENKLIADYMSGEHELSVVDYDVGTMTGYKYVVSGEEEGTAVLQLQDGREEGGCRTIDPNTNGQQLVTIDMVWECDAPLLSRWSRSGNRCKDLCLSFALFKLLRRRLRGYPLHESCLNKTRDLVKLGLLAGDHHERMYRVIGAELGFLFDMFYARYPSPQQSLIPETVVFASVVVASMATLFSPVLFHYRAPAHGEANATIAAATRFDIWLTRMMLVLFVALESFQYLLMLFSDWHKVKLMCRYVRDKSWQNRPVLENLLRLMFQVRLTPYWDDSVGQHSVIYSAVPVAEHQYGCILHLPLTGLVCIGRKDLENRLEIVQSAIYHFLKSSLSRIQYGEHTLRRNGVLGDFQWAISKETTGHIILIWHIATSVCHFSFIKGPLERGNVESYHVATILSSYCVHLMSSAPELLPDHIYDTQLLFKAVQLRARQCLQGCSSNAGIYDRLTDYQPKDRYDTILAEGKRLGDQIERSMGDTGKRWKMLAEMWMEMLLSIAPSDNVTGHIQKLATGGELITHLWALLTHAGIVQKRLNWY